MKNDPKRKVIDQSMQQSTKSVIGIFCVMIFRAVIIFD